MDDDLSDTHIFKTEVVLLQPSKLVDFLNTRKELNSLSNHKK